MFDVGHLFPYNIWFVCLPMCFARIRILPWREGKRWHVVWKYLGLHCLYEPQHIIPTPKLVTRSEESHKGHFFFFFPQIGFLEEPLWYLNANISFSRTSELVKLSKD